MARESRGESALSPLTMTKFAVVLKPEKPLPVFRTLLDIRGGGGLSVGLNHRKQNQHDDNEHTHHGSPFSNP
jgi:hypothetical protein